MNPLEGALACSNIGLAVFPVWGVQDGACRCPRKDRCDSPGKHPLMTGWQRVATADQVQIRAWAEKYPGTNFGVPCGSRTRVVVVDVDGYQGGRLRDIPTRPTVISTSGRGFHAWYRANGTVIQGGDKKFGTGLGLRGEGHFVVAPGSLHVNGKHYGRHRWGWENFAQRPVLKIGDAPELGRVPPAGPLPEKIPEGHRRTVMLSLAGSMRRRGSTGEAILAALAVENRIRCVPPLEEDELRSIAFDVEGRYQPEVELLPELADDTELGPEEELLVPLPWQAMLKDGVPPVDYLDPPYFVRGARTWGWGPSGTAKSIFAMWKAAALTRAGHKVVYISEENPLVEDIRRLGRLKPDPERLVVYHRRGVDLTRPEWVAAAVEASAGAAMTVFDSWTDCWQGDENDNRAVQQFDATVLKPLQALGVAPLVIHHTGHPGMFGARRGVSAGRGASSLGQKADVVLAFSAGKTGELQTFKLSYPKGRVGGEAPPEQLFRVVDLEDGGLDILPEGSVLELEDTALVEDIVQAILGSETGDLTSGEVRALAGGRGRQQRVMELLQANPRLEVVDGGTGRKKLYSVRPDRLWEE